MNRFLALFLLTISLTSTSFISAQPNQTILDRVLLENDEKEILEAATTLIIDGYLYKAEPFVENLYARDAENPQYNYLKGFLQLYYHKDHAGSLDYFSKSVKKVDKNLRLLEPETNVTYDVFFHIGHANHFIGNIDEAEKNYDLFLENTKTFSYLIDEAKIRTQQIDVARELLKKPGKEIIEPVSIINTEHQEYSPVVSANGRELYYTTRRAWEDLDQDAYRNPFDNSFPEDVYYSLRDRVEGWGEGEMLPFCQGLINEASISLTPNMNQLFVYSDSIGNGNIFYTDFTQSEFKAVDIIEFDKLNTKFWETHFIINSDSTLVVFASDRKHGFGGRDLWFMSRDEDGNWTKPTNMGENINSEGEEDAPFLQLDGNTLYYATNGPASMGGFDIMRSTYNNGAWTKGENLGTPINSTGDDIFFTTSYDGRETYFTSFRVGGEGEKDIYKITYPDNTIGADIIALEGGVIDVTDNADEIDLQVILKNLTTNTTETVYVRHNDYFNILEDCQDYELTYINKITGETISQESFKTNCNNEQEYFVKYYYNGNYILNGTITDASTSEPISNASLELFNPETNETIATINTDATGKYSYEGLEGVAPGDVLNLEIRASAEDYESANWKLEKVLDRTGIITYDGSLKPSDNYAELQDILASFIIYYDFDRSNIRNSEVEIMNKVVTFMNEHPEVRIELSSHTDCRGSDSYNMKLSERRAESARKYIAEKINDPSRLVAKGYGETKLTNSCDCQAGNACASKDHQLNRRTEFKLIME